MPVDDASKPQDHTRRMRLRALGLLAIICAIGCGTTKTQLATEQLLVSDAVDKAVADIDFAAMAGKKVFFDDRYIKNIKGVGFVNSEYIISSLRQQMVAADCRLQEAEDDAEFVVEARVGTLGTNGHEIVYGVPANNALSTAASLVPNSPSIPSIPELALVKKDAQLGAAKVAVFAYERESRRPVWQSGISKAKSTAQNFWFFGAGPFQRGSVYDGTQFAGSRIRIPHRSDDGTPAPHPSVSYSEQFYFPRVIARPTDAEIGLVGYEQQLPPVVLAPARPAGGEPEQLPTSSEQEVPLPRLTPPQEPLAPTNQ